LINGESEDLPEQLFPAPVNIRVTPQTDSCPNNQPNYSKYLNSAHYKIDRTAKFIYNTPNSVHRIEAMGNEKILVIDDSPEILNLFSEYLSTEGYEVDTAEDGAKGISLIEKNFYDLILTDLKMPDTDGMEVLKYIRENSPDSLCIILTGYGTIKNAVEATQKGAYDYLTKPVKMDEILVTFRRAFEHRDLKRENVHLRNQLKKKNRFENIVGDSEGMLKVFGVVEKVADTDSTVLILGESGTGKELVAQAIHYHSYRRDKLFVPVNCAAIPSELLESELFGHEKGAFTNAIRMRVGRFELANGGTVFLDEIGDMIPMLQSKLLRVLQERNQDHQDRYPHYRRHPPEPEGVSAAEKIPGRPVLSAQCHSPGNPSPPREKNGHPASGPLLPGSVQQKEKEKDPRHPGRRDGAPDAVRLAGKCAGVGKHHRKGDHSPGWRLGDVAGSAG
jgi:CheY-like chemotaxis protein